MLQSCKAENKNENWNKYMLSSHFWTPYLWNLYPTCANPIHPPPHSGSIYKPPPQEMPLRDLWKGQNYQVADKYIEYTDTTFKINIL